MIIQLKKFGLTLVSRDDGKEALAAFQPNLNNAAKDETIEIDFSGINTFSPSWADEFIMPIFKRFKNRLILSDLNNPSVKVTVNLLEKINGIKFLVK